MIVGFALGVDQFNVETTNLQIHAFLVGQIGLSGAGRQKSLILSAHVIAAPGYRTELTLIDGQVIAIGRIVSVKARLNVFMPHHSRAWVTTLLGVAEKRAAPTHMVHMTMGIDQTVKWVF